MKIVDAVPPVDAEASAGEVPEIIGHDGVRYTFDEYFAVPADETRIVYTNDEGKPVRVKRSNYKG